MSGFIDILRHNRNYRNCWLGQTVSEIGDHFNSIAVLSLALHLTGSGFTVGAVMIARVLPAILAGPVAGVVLDRLDRRKVMLASDIFRGLIALAHILLLTYRETWLLYTLSGLLMFASPFFNSGRSAILPKLASKEELHTANALSFTLSAIAIWNLKSSDGHWRSGRGPEAVHHGSQCQDFRDGLRRMTYRPLILGIGLSSRCVA